MVSQRNTAQFFDECVYFLLTFNDGSNERGVGGTAQSSVARSAFIFTSLATDENFKTLYVSSNIDAQGLMLTIMDAFPFPRK